MPTQKKVEQVEELRDRIERSSVALAADYRGLSVVEMVQLRRTMREAGVEMRVVKNRLFLLAAKAAGRPEFAELVDGPTAIIFGYEDVAAPARAASQYARQARNAFAVRNGALDGQLLSAAEVGDLAELPSREVLLGRFAGALQAPLARLSGLFEALLPTSPGRLVNDSIQTLSGLLDARADQMETT